VYDQKIGFSGKFFLISRSRACQVVMALGVVPKAARMMGVCIGLVCWCMRMLKLRVSLAGTVAELLISIHLPEIEIKVQLKKSGMYSKARRILSWTGEKRFCILVKNVLLK
jgi:hypothetical protein